LVLKGEKATADRRKLHNEELHDMYCSPNIIWLTESRRMMSGVKKNAYKVRWEDLKERKKNWCGCVGDTAVCFT
jgi:hypothetical protein